MESTASTFSTEPSATMLLCHACAIQERRSQDEVVDEDIILCNHCGSEAVEFIAVETPAPVRSQEDRTKEVVDAEIKKLMACLNIFGFKKETTKPLLELPSQFNRSMTSFFNSSDAFLRNLGTLPVKTRGLEMK